MSASYDSVRSAVLTQIKNLYRDGKSLREIAADPTVLSGFHPEVTKPALRERRLWHFIDGLVKRGELTPRRMSQRTATPAALPAPKDAKAPTQESHEKTKDSWAITYGPTPINSEEGLLDHFEIDRDVWFVDKLVVNKWDMGYTTKEGAAQSLPLFQIKAWLKRRAVVDDTKRILEELKKEAANHAPIYQPFARGISEGRPRHMLEISIPDAHLGKYAWHEETRADYDVDIAVQLYMEALEDIVSKAEGGYEFDRVCYVIGNDMLNADNLENTTARGTPQTTDGRQHRTFRRAKETVIAAIERLMPIADVDVIVVPGNHDLMSAWYLGDTVESWFNKAPNVHVRNEPALRKYYQYGRNMIQFTHGSEEKHALLAQIAAQEEPEMWGRTRFREAHIGHLHKSSVMRTLNDETGFRVRMLPSLCAAEDWHASKGYVGAVRSAEALVWNYNGGLVGHHIYNVPRTYEGDVQLYARP